MKATKNDDKRAKTKNESKANGKMEEFRRKQFEKIKIRDSKEETNRLTNFSLKETVRDKLKRVAGGVPASEKESSGKGAEKKLKPDKVPTFMDSYLRTKALEAIDDEKVEELKKFEAPKLFEDQDHLNAIFGNDIKNVKKSERVAKDSAFKISDDEYFGPEELKVKPTQMR